MNRDFEMQTQRGIQPGGGDPRAALAKLMQDPMMAAILQRQSARGGLPGMPQDQGSPPGVGLDMRRGGMPIDELGMDLGAMHESQDRGVPEGVGMDMRRGGMPMGESGMDLEALLAAEQGGSPEGVGFDARRGGMPENELGMDLGGMQQMERAAQSRVARRGRRGQQG